MTHAWLQLTTNMFTCNDDGSVANLINQLWEIKGATVVSFANVHALNLAKDNKMFLSTLLESDFLLRDGIGLEIFCKMLNIKPGVNLNGTDLIPKIIKAGNKTKSVALFGTESPWLESSATKLHELGYSDVHILHGFAETEQYIEYAQSIKPRLIVLAMGMPKQEYLSLELKSALADQDVLILNGGAILDFISERHPRAPSLFQKMRLEWLYRLSQEPKRLWRRNFGNLTFIIEALGMMLRKRGKD